MVAAACFLAVRRQLRPQPGSPARGERGGSGARSSGRERELKWSQRREENIAWEAGVRFCSGDAAGTLAHRLVGLENNGSAISQREALWKSPRHGSIGCSLARGVRTAWVKRFANTRVCFEESERRAWMQHSLQFVTPVCWEKKQLFQMSPFSISSLIPHMSIKHAKWAITDKVNHVGQRERTTKWMHK